MLELSTIGKRTGLPGEHGCVLLVDHVRPIIDALTRDIWSLGLDVVCAAGGREALAVAGRVQFSLLLLRLELSDIDGLGVVGALRGTGREAPFIAMTASEAMGVEARALGALRVFLEPFDLRELSAAVAGFAGLTAVDGSTPAAKGVSESPNGGTPVHNLSPILEPRTACERWCNLVIGVATADRDLKTNEACAEHLGVGAWAFAASCRRVGVTASTTRNFARAIRAILRSGQTWKPDLILDIDDVRTLRKFEERSAVRRGRETRPPSLDEFLERQRWIPRDNPAAAAFERWVRRPTR